MVRDSPESLARRLIRAKADQAAGRYADAARLCREILSEDPDHLEALLMLAGLAQHAGEYEEAIGLANRAIELRPDAPNGYAVRGYCFLEVGQAEAAAASLSMAVTRAPGPPILHHVLGSALRRLGRNEEALQAFRRAAALGPTVVETQISLGQIHLDLGNRDEAVVHFRRAARLEPTSARGQTQLAKALTEEADYTGAEAALRTALSLAPTAVATRAMLGEALLHQGRFGEARAELLAVLDARPDLDRTYLHLAQCGKVEDRSFLDRTESRLADLAIDDTDRRFLHYALGKALDDLGDYAAAIQHFDEANRIMRRLARPPFDPIVHEAQIDFAIDQIDEEFIRKNRTRGATDETPIFIVGMIRSGTTLVEQVLSSHPDVAPGGELRFWRDHTHKAIDPPNVTTVASEYLKVIARLSGGKRRVTDKMPLNFMSLGVIHAALPNARIIHCRRDPLDTCLSIYLTPFGTPINYAHDRETIVGYYQSYQRLMEHWLQVIPADRLLELDYEELVEDRESVSRRMVAFAGLDWNDACLSPEQNQRTVRTPSAWQVRQPVYRTSVARWHSYEPWLGAFRTFLPRRKFP